jgi:hypothetical protein
MATGRRYVGLATDPIVARSSGCSEKHQLIIDEVFPRRPVGFGGCKAGLGVFDERAELFHLGLDTITVIAGHFF